MADSSGLSGDSKLLCESKSPRVHQPSVRGSMARKDLESVINLRAPIGS